MEATITVKGQITLPKALRNLLHLKTGDKVVFEDQGKGNYLIKPKNSDVSSLKGMIHYTGKPKTLEEMEQAVQAGFK